MIFNSIRMHKCQFAVPHGVFAFSTNFALIYTVRKTPSTTNAIMMFLSKSVKPRYGIEQSHKKLRDFVSKLVMHFESEIRQVF